MANYQNLSKKQLIKLLKKQDKKVKELEEWKCEINDLKVAELNGMTDDELDTKREYLLEQIGNLKYERDTLYEDVENLEATKSQLEQQIEDAEDADE